MPLPYDSFICKFTYHLTDYRNSNSLFEAIPTFLISAKLYIPIVHVSIRRRNSLAFGILQLHAYRLYIFLAPFIFSVLNILGNSFFPELLFVRSLADIEDNCLFLAFPFYPRCITERFLCEAFILIFPVFTTCYINVVPPCRA